MSNVARISMPVPTETHYYISYRSYAMDYSSASEERILVFADTPKEAKEWYDTLRVKYPDDGYGKLMVFRYTTNTRKPAITNVTKEFK